MMYLSVYSQCAGLGTILFQFSLGLLTSLLFATTPRVASAVAARDYRLVGEARTARGLMVAGSSGKCAGERAARAGLCAMQRVGCSV